MAPPNMSTFDQLCVAHNCDKGNLPNGIGHGYGPHYEAVLEPLRHKSIRLLEIGVGDGKSIKVWLDYFTHPQVEIIGVDNSDCWKGPAPRFTFIQGDQTNPKFLQTLQDVYDVVIDDGSHTCDGIIPSFEALWPFVKSGGLYIIEDLRCSYMPGYHVPGWGTQMGFIKQLMDDINAQTNYKPGGDDVNYPQGTDGTRGIEWLKFSTELAIIKKK
jgi:Methyltransferase domain